MPLISFVFDGSCQANVIDAVDKNGNKVDVADMTGPDLVRKLQSGDLSISLGHTLTYCDVDNEVITIRNFNSVWEPY